MSRQRHRAAQWPGHRAGAGRRVAADTGGLRAAAQVIELRQFGSDCTRADAGTSSGTRAGRHPGSRSGCWCRADCRVSGECTEASRSSARRSWRRCAQARPHRRWRCRQTAWRPLRQVVARLARCLLCGQQHAVLAELVISVGERRDRRPLPFSDMAGREQRHSASRARWLAASRATARYAAGWPARPHPGLAAARTGRRCPLAAARPRWTDRATRRCGGRRRRSDRRRRGRCGGEGAHGRRRRRRLPKPTQVGGENHCSAGEGSGDEQATGAPLLVHGSP